MTSSDLLDDILEQYVYKPLHRGVILSPTFTSIGKNKLCGDSLTVYVSLKDDIVTELKFEATGCVLSKAGIGLMSELIIGKHIHDPAICEAAVLETLNIDINLRLPCAMLGLYTFREGIASFKAGQAVSQHLLA